MKTIKIKFEEAEVEQKFVDYSKVLELVKDEDNHLMELWDMFKEGDKYLADSYLERACEVDVIIRKLNKVFGGEFD